jgi:hypothetical protein
MVRIRRWMADRPVDGLAAGRVEGGHMEIPAWIVHGLKKPRLETTNSMKTRRFEEIHAALATRIQAGVRREEYLDHMTFRRNVRPLFTELFGPIVGLKEEWKAQGASPSELDLSAFRYRGPEYAYLTINTGWLDARATEVLEETDEYLIGRDQYGRRVKLCKGSATLPLPLDHPVRNRADWLKVKHQYEFSERRFPEDWMRAAREHLAEGHVIALGIPGGFDEPRQLMGEEAVCVAYYEQPELIRDMVNTIEGTVIRIIERVSEAVPIDELSVHEDMAGKSGPLAGPRQIEEFIAPYYRKAWQRAQSAGARLFSLDCDGDINRIIPSLLDAGINLVYPMEPASNMDIVKARREYGTRLAFVGGLDKHVIRRTREEIVSELEYKIPPLVASGGCMLSLDHRIPNGTPLEHYRFYIEKAWEILDRESARL